MKYFAKSFMVVEICITSSFNFTKFFSFFFSLTKYIKYSSQKNLHPRHIPRLFLNKFSVSYSSCDLCYVLSKWMEGIKEDQRIGPAWPYIHMACECALDRRPSLTWASIGKCQEIPWITHREREKCENEGGQRRTGERASHSHTGGNIESQSATSRAPAKCQGRSLSLDRGAFRAAGGEGRGRGDTATI